MTYDQITILWAVIIIGFVILEVLTPNLVTIGFAIAGIIPLVLHFFNVALPFQLAAYVISLAVVLYFFLPILRKFSKIDTRNDSSDIKTNLDIVVGGIGLCTEIIEPLNSGAVRIDNKTWTAITNDNTTIYPNEQVLVKHIEGAKLVVVKNESEVL